MLFVACYRFQDFISHSVSEFHLLPLLYAEQLTSLKKSQLHLQRVPELGERQLINKVLL